jgi:hypothetical protein
MFLNFFPLPFIDVDRVYVYGKSFQPSLMFAGKAGASPS